MSRVLDDNGGVTEKVFFDWDREFSSLKSQMSALAGKMRAAKKRAADDGIDVQEYEYQRKRRDRPLEERRKAHENGLLYLKFWKDPLGAKMNSIPELKDEVGLTDEERTQKWEDEGYVVGARGGNRSECPHPDPNSLGARTWSIGYDKGQLMLAPKKSGKAAKPVDDGPTGGTVGERTDSVTGTLSGGVQPGATGSVEAAAPAGKVAPKDEPEVAAAKARGGKGRTKGVTYWHNAELRKVYEVTTADPDPVGAISITKPEFEKLQAEYAKQEEDDWNSTAAAAKAETGAETGEDDDDNEDPPGA